MISGVDVVVVRPGAASTDRFNNKVAGEPSRETVRNVLVSPGPTDDLEASRPEGVVVALTLHFPKDYADDLEGCSVILPSPWSGEYRVVGSPHPYIDANTPGNWHMPVEVEAAYG